MTLVRIHADRTALPTGAPHVAILDPFWGPGEDEEPSNPLRGRFRPWRKAGAGVYELVSFEEAECVILPAAWEHYERQPEAEHAARRVANEAAAAGKPLVVFYVSDSTAAVPLEHAHVFRTSLCRSTRGERDYAMPALSVDVAEVDLRGKLDLREWTSRPVVGFCGFAPGFSAGLGGRIRRALPRLRGASEHPAALRGRACRALERSPTLETNFVVRSGFWAGVIGKGGAIDYERMREVRRHFVCNLVGSDYVLAARGGGNFSYRLYETMSAARIPLFVDTDCVLPFEDELDWCSLVVWVDEYELDAIGERVADFHARLGPEGFREQQQECRRIWVDRLSPEGFYRSLAPRLAALPP